MSYSKDYSAATTSRIRALLKSLSIQELYALLPGMQATGGDGLQLLQAELNDRKPARLPQAA